MVKTVVGMNGAIRSSLSVRPTPNIVILRIVQDHASLYPHDVFMSMCDGVFSIIIGYRQGIDI